MSQFIDSKTGKTAYASSYGFVGESDATSSVSNLRDFIDDEYDKETRLSAETRNALRSGDSGKKLWALKFDDKVEIVTDAEYRSRRP